MSDPQPDPYKDFLIQQRNLACGILSIIDGRPGPIPEPSDRDKIAEAMRDAGVVADTLVNGPTSPMYTETKEWLMWPAIDFSNRTLMSAAGDACAQAQAALDKYCATQPGGSAASAPESEKEDLLREAAHAIWNCRSLYCFIIDRAGIDHIPAG